MARVAHLDSGSHFFWEKSCPEVCGGVSVGFVVISKKKRAKTWISVFVFFSVVRLLLKMGGTSHRTN
jgi:hypothetical protein